MSKKKNPVVVISQFLYLIVRKIKKQAQQHFLSIILLVIPNKKDAVFELFMTLYH